jgi:NADH-quinone oxidoreductase subunit L
MVTAGVYMIGRLNFLYSMSPTALAIVATVGVVTALFAATIGFAQNDIKKILAYSTVSQLGYMFLGMGTGIYTAGIFHLVTHAFFKACLFLGAGSIILGMHHEQHINKMGGLKNYMPITYWTFLAATLALAGIFPLSGFFSKDEILWQVYSMGHTNHLYYMLWALGLVGALCTAFYMFRLVSLVFYGKLRVTNDKEYDEADVLDSSHIVEDHHQPMVPHEQTKSITSVLIILAILSVLAGFLGVPHALGKIVHLPNFFEEWMKPTFAAIHATAGEGNHSGAIEYLLMILSVIVALSGSILATYLYVKRIDIIEKIVSRIKVVYKVVFNKYYIDEIYDLIIVKRLLNFIDILKRFDQRIIDGLVNAMASLGVFWSAVSGWWDWFFVDGTVNVVAETTIITGKKLRKVHTGRIQHYFYILILGVIILIVWRIL